MIDTASFFVGAPEDIGPDHPGYAASVAIREMIALFPSLIARHGPAAAHAAFLGAFATIAASVGSPSLLASSITMLEEAVVILKALRPAGGNC